MDAENKYWSTAVVCVAFVIICIATNITQCSMHEYSINALKIQLEYQRQLKSQSDQSAKEQ